MDSQKEILVVTFDKHLNKGTVYADEYEFILRYGGFAPRICLDGTKVLEELNTDDFVPDLIIWILHNEFHQQTIDVLKIVHDIFSPTPKILIVVPTDFHHDALQNLSDEVIDSKFDPKLFLKIVTDLVVTS